MARKIPFLFIFAAILLAAAGVGAEEAPDVDAMDEFQVLDAIRKGKLKVTDEMIDAQRTLHPELEGLSNQEVKRKLEDKANGESLGDAKQSVPKQDRGNRAAPGGGGEARKPAAGKEPPSSPSRFPQGLTRFGYDFFASGPSPSSSSGGGTPALPDYVLSPGDELLVYTWGRENANQKSIIDNEGMIHFPPLQPMRMAGLKFAEAQALLVKEIENINGVKASVGLGKLRSIRIFVLGEVTNPGSYVVPAGATVTGALFQSGGIRDIGSLRGIQLKRNGKVVANLDLYEMLLRGNNATDRQLLSGDVIFVPVAPIQVAVTGMVKRPGIYEVKSGTKVLEAMDLAGGLSSNAFKGRVRLDRVESHKRMVMLDVGLEKMTGASNAILQDGDILKVDEVLTKEFGVVYLEGNVQRPGRYEYKAGMTVLDVLAGPKELKSETYLSYGHIKRSTDEDETAQLLPFSLKDVFEKTVSVALQPRDTVVIYSKYDIMDQPEVQISGSVRRPGQYRYVERMRISDLIIMGGGLTFDAYLPEAHLIRKLKAEESDSLFSTLIKVNLSNLVERPAEAQNSELRPWDSLIVFPRSNFVLPKAVTIQGAVKGGGQFELTGNMGIPELVSRAEGLSKTPFLLSVEVVRKTVVHDSVVQRDIHRLNLKDILEGKLEFKLQDGDAVYIRDVVDHAGMVVVTLSGEFNFPGKYEVAKGERLSSLIERAGGFTRSAYIPGAVFIRRAVKDRQLMAVEEINRKLQAQLDNLLIQTTNEKDRANIQAAIAQRKTILDDIRKAPYLGRVVVSLDREMSFKGGDEDITLDHADSLHVMSRPTTISIMGEVFSPTNIIVSRKNADISDCISRAGGVNEYGDEDNIYYLKPDGTILTPKNTSWFGWRSVEPGGIIVIPSKGPKRDYLDALTKVTQIIYQMAVSVGVVATLLN